MKVSVLQTNPGTDRARNLSELQALIDTAIDQENPDLIVLPEYVEYYGGSEKDKVAAAHVFPGGPAYELLQSIARDKGVWIHAGSLLESSSDAQRIYNTTVVFNRAGDEVARYRKLHLFDIEAPDGTGYRESATVQAGDDVVLYDLEGWKVGCAICYDIRFAELFLSLAAQGADLIVVPAAFTLQTGKDHWEVLLRARAIETQTYVVASAQWGPNKPASGDTRHTYGHSLVCDPWGHVIARASDGVGVVSTRLDQARVAHVRRLIPMKSHRRLACP